METKKVFSAINAVMREISHIGKDNKNLQQGYKFRSIDQVYNVLHPLLSKHGIFSYPTTLSMERSERSTRSGSVMYHIILEIKYTFVSSEDGSSFESTVYGEAMDSGDKTITKAMAFAHKYALIQIFSIPTEDNIDPDNFTPEETVKKSVSNLNQTLNQPSKYQEILETFKLLTAGKTQDEQKVFLKEKLDFESFADIKNLPDSEIERLIQILKTKQDN